MPTSWPYLSLCPYQSNIASFQAIWVTVIRPKTCNDSADSHNYNVSPTRDDKFGEKFLLKVSKPFCKVVSSWSFENLPLFQVHSNRTPLCSPQPTEIGCNMKLNYHFKECSNWLNRLSSLPRLLLNGGIWQCQSYVILLVDMAGSNGSGLWYSIATSSRFAPVILVFLNQLELAMTSCWWSWLFQWLWFVLYSDVATRKGFRSQQVWHLPYLFADTI